MDYVIEGTISELSFDENYFSLSGTEGYALKHGDKKYNVLCPKDMPEKNKYAQSVVLSQDFHFPIQGDKELLLHALSSNKKIRIRLSVNITEVYIDLQKVKEGNAESYISLLSE